MTTLLLGLDLGTTSIKAVLYDPQRGRVLRIAAQPTPVDRLAGGWSEHDPAALWQAAARCLREAAGGQPVRALAISSMAEAGLLVDAGGQPLAPAIAWYDRRSEPQAAWIEQQVGQDALYRITGQRASPSFGVTKILWERAHRAEAFSRAARWLPLPAYLLERLCGQAVVDYSIAARTLLFDQESKTWSSALLRACDLEPAFLPLVVPAGTVVGALDALAAEETGLPSGALCLTGGHDHLCAALAAGAARPGALVDSTGTANALLLVADRFMPEPALAAQGFASYAALLPGQFALKGGLKAAGSALEWLARLLSGAGGAPEFAALEAAARAGAGRRAGPLWLPHLIGSGTPQGDRFSRAAAVGLRYEHGEGDLFRGLLESLACWTRHNLEAMADASSLPIDSVALLGGVTRLPLLSQIKADMLNQPLQVPRIREAAAVGAALLAGLGSGVFASPEEAVSSLRYARDTINPNEGRAAWYDTLYREAYLPLYAALRPVHAALERLDSHNAGEEAT